MVVEWSGYLVAQCNGGLVYDTRTTRLSTGGGELGSRRLVVFERSHSRTIRGNMPMVDQWGRCFFVSLCVLIVVSAFSGLFHLVYQLSLDMNALVSTYCHVHLSYVIL